MAGAFGTLKKCANSSDKHFGKEHTDMNRYESPMLFTNEELSEGVYLASGDALAGGCYTASATIHQTPQAGRGDYRIQVNGQHNADHTREAQTLTISFNLPVTYSSSGGTYVSGSGTQTLVINYGYHQNPTDNIGLGDLVVTADAGLAVTSVSITD